MSGLPMFWRRFLLTCFAVIRQHDPKLITPYLKTLESLIQLLIDREEGRVQAWEGIRVVRTHRV